MFRISGLAGKALQLRVFAPLLFIFHHGLGVPLIGSEVQFLSGTPGVLNQDSRNRAIEPVKEARLMFIQVRWSPTA
jgi:hypothetical protein